MTHSARLGGHGGRGHRVSRKTVRERRRSGVQPRRGHNFDNRLRNVERLQAEVRDAKAYQPFDPETVIAALVASASPALRDDIGQELWVLALQGATEPELRVAYRDVRLAAAKVEFGDFGVLRLDQPLHDRHGQEFGALVDLMDEQGRLPFGQAPLSPDEVSTPEWRAEVRSGRAAVALVVAKAERARARRRRLARWRAAAAAKAEARRLRVEARTMRIEAAAAAKAEARRLRVEAMQRRRDQIEQRRLVERFYTGVRKVANRASRALDKGAWDVLIGMQRRATWRSDAAVAGWSDARKVEHGRKHRAWWAATPEARTAMADKNRRMWLVKGDQIAVRLKESGTDWWARQPPEVREQRREVMRQVWARRRAAQQQIAA